MQNTQSQPDVISSVFFANLPIPLDDGACEHLENRPMPDISLCSVNDQKINVSRIPGWSVIFCYPMTGGPGISIPEGWVQIPGAAGCTSQTCSFRDNYTELKRHNVSVYGISTQVSETQKEAVIRLNLPYPLLSDSDHSLSSALKLPLLEVDCLKLIKRLTLILEDGVIKKCFYPVFPPDKNVVNVLAWLAENKT
jgi:peroxiredoxin